MELLLFANVVQDPRDTKMDRGIAPASWLGLKPQSNLVMHAEINHGNI